MDRCALFVDAGYLLADGAMAVHGTRHREAVSWDFPGLLQLMTDLGRERTGLPLLRCYWYETSVDGRGSPELDALADLPGLKLRIIKIRPGRREGIDAQVHRDVMTLARNGAICDAVVVSGDEDLTQAVVDAQDLGIRVSVVNVAVDSSPSVSRLLRRECDDFIEVSPGHLRPFVNVVSGDVSPSMGNGQAPLSNGQGGGGQSIPVPSRPALQYPGFAGQPSSTPPPASTGPPRPAHASPSHASPSHASPSHASPSHAPPEKTQPPATGPQPVVLPPQQPAPSQQPAGPPQHVPQPAYSGPQAAPVASPAQQQQSSLSEAVKAAHQEGTAFGDSVARDAPALWLEAVLARKPRMPSDLEARLLQGSSLPIDHLLHDEVRHALRRGFWDALERSRP